MNQVPSAAKSAPDPVDNQSVSEAVVTAVADADGVSPVDVVPPLYEAIDPDALETALASMSSGPHELAGRVEFAYSGYEVAVTEDGDVSVTPSDPDQR